MLKKSFYAVLVVLFFFANQSVFAQLADAPWPRFRKDIRNTGKTNVFGTDVGKLKWKVLTEGPVTSSPAVCLDKNGDEIVYVGSADNRFYAIDAETGSVEWTYTTGGAIELTSPACDEDGTVYVGSNDGKLYAFDTFNIAEDETTGNPIPPTPKWIFSTNGAISSSPNIYTNGDIIVASNDGYIYSIKPDGSGYNWRYYIGASWSSPAIDSNLSQVYIGSWRRQACTYSWLLDNGTIRTGPGWDVNAYALNVNSGVEQWAFPCSFCPPGGMLSSPAILPDSSILFPMFQTYDNDGCPGDIHDFNLYRVDSSDGSAEWALEIGGNDFYGSPAVIEDNSFFIPSGNNMVRVLPEMETYLETATVGQRIESSPALDGRKYAFFGSNGGYIYCACADCPETPLIWQYPRQGEDPLFTQDGTTVASVVSSPAIGSDNRRSVYVGASDGAVYAFYDGAVISGIVREIESNGSKTPLRSVKMTLTSSFTDEIRVTYTGTDGTFSFPGVENYTYTITPEKQGFIFREAFETRTVKNDLDIDDLSFEATSGVAVRGRTVDASDDALKGVTVQLSGANTGVSEKVKTDDAGWFEFSNLNIDTYTITPSFDGYGFDPSSQLFTITEEIVYSESALQLPQTFRGIKGYQISGQVISISTFDATITSGLPNITLTLTGEGQTQTTTTDTNGFYGFLGLDSGSYTIAPQNLVGSTLEFTPESRQVTIDDENVDHVDFEAGTGISISGAFLQADNATLSSIQVHLYEYNSTTSQVTSDAPITVSLDSDGNYVFIEVEANQTYLIKPELDGYGFDPIERVVTTVTGTLVTGQDFVVISGYYISGRVTNTLGLPEDDVLMNIEGLEATATETNSDGTYVFTGLAPGDYTVSIDTTNYESLRSSQEVEIINESKEDVNFIVNSTCAVTMLNIPPFGGKGTLVNIYGTNFGWSEPPDNETVTIVDDDEVLNSGVYFANLNSDASTWIQADVKSWTNFRIVVEAPSGFGFYVIKVIRITNESEGTGCGKTYPTNFFLYIM